MVGGRVAQGVFGALLAPSALAVIVAAFAPAQRGSAVGSWLAWSGIATIVGPLVGGQLIDAASWRWIFAINIPFVLATLAGRVHRRAPARAGRRAAAGRLAGRAAVVPRARRADARADPPAECRAGAALDVLVPGIAGVVFFALFLLREATHRLPDAAAGAVQAPQLRGGQHRDVRDVRRAVGAVLLPHPLPPAGGGLRRARGRGGDAADHGGDVPALQARGRARGPLRPAPVHGRRAAAWPPRACC